MTTFHEGRRLVETAGERGLVRAPSTASGADTRADATRAVLAERRGWAVRNRAGFMFLAGDVVVLTVTVAVAGVHPGIAALFVLLVLAGIQTGGLYRSRFDLSTLDHAPKLLRIGLVAGALVAVITTAGALFGFMTAFTAWGTVLFACAGLVVGRAITYQVVRTLRGRRHLAHRALILGSGMVGQELALQMREHPKYGLRPIGFVDDNPLVSGGASVVPVLGPHARLAQLIEACGIEEVVVAFTADPGASLVEVLRTADRLHCEVSVVPRLFELGASGGDTDEVNGIPLVRLRRPSFRSPTWMLKRAMDILVSGVALLVLSPLLGLISLALRITDGPGVIFRQQRVGLDGHSFELLKFRSLRPVDEIDSGTTWSIKNDERLGPMGKFIRRTSIDELPQLWNILRGDMSLVGPRPERPYFVATFGEAFPRYDARHRVPCGLTGWAQIHGLRGDTSIEERARFDNYYIENWSLWLDTKIMLRTAASLMKGSG